MTPQWISKEEAGVRLGVSPRRALELAKEGRIQWDEAKNPRTGKMVTRIQAGSVERFIHERGSIPDPEPRRGADNGAMQAETLETDCDLEKVRAQVPNELIYQALVRGLRDGDATRMISAPPSHLWLTLKEAADYSHLPTDILEGCIGKGEIKAMFIGKHRRGGPWRIRRQDLEAFAG